MSKFSKSFLESSEVDLAKCSLTFQLSKLLKTCVKGNSTGVPCFDYYSNHSGLFFQHLNGSGIIKPNLVLCPIRAGHLTTTSNKNWREFSPEGWNNILGLE